MLALGVLSLFPLGPITGVPGLFLSRLTRPFGREALWAYRLCWIGCVAPLVVAYYWYGSKTLTDLSGWFLIGLHIFLIYVWIEACRKFLLPPATSLFKAILIALAGTLFLAPMLLPSMGDVIAVPMAFGLLKMILADPPYSLRAFGYAVWIPLVFLAPPHLVVYWPANKDFD